jgi:hypothetical protein
MDGCAPAGTFDKGTNYRQESTMRRIYIRDRRENDQRRAFDALGARLSDIIGDATRRNVVRLRA